MSLPFLPLLAAIAVAAPFDDEPLDLFVARAMSELQEKTRFHVATWHLDEAKWSVDQDTGTITFTQEDGTTARAPVQIVGTLDTETGTFLWGWDHPSVSPPLRAHAEAARAWGERHGLAKYTTRLIEVDSDEIRQYAAVAARLGGAQGVYRCPTGRADVWVTFGELTLSKAAREPAR